MANIGTEEDRMLELEWQGACRVAQFNCILVLLSFLILFFDRSKNTINSVVALCCVVGIISGVMFLRYLIKALRNQD